MAAGVVVGGVFLAANEQLGVEKLAIGTGADLVNGGRVQVHEDGARNMLAAARLGEEGLEGARVAGIRAIGVRASVGTEAVLEEITVAVAVSNRRRHRVVSRDGRQVDAQLPSRVSELGASLAQVNMKDLPGNGLAADVEGVHISGGGERRSTAPGSHSSMLLTSPFIVE